MSSKELPTWCARWRKGGKNPYIVSCKGSQDPMVRGKNKDFYLVGFYAETRKEAWRMFYDSWKTWESDADFSENIENLKAQAEALRNSPKYAILDED